MRNCRLIVGYNLTGTDATAAYEDVGHSEGADQELALLCIGTLQEPVADVVEAIEAAAEETVEASKVRLFKTKDSLYKMYDCIDTH